MAEATRWILWRLEKRGEMPTKVPYDAKTLRHAKSNDSSTWCDLDTAREALKSGGGFSGLGFVLGDGFAGVDLDGCVIDTDVMPWAWSVIRKLDTYTEVSPSGSGVKLFLMADVKRGRKKQLGTPLNEGGKTPGIEIYGAGRYFAVTEDSLHISEACEERQKPLDDIIAEHWPEPVATPRFATIRHNSPNDIIERAAKYMQRVEPAITGSGGHGVTFRAACALVLGFGLSVEDARPLLYKWNQSCLPPWSEKELEHKLKQANAQGGERGYLLKNESDVDLSQFENFSREDEQDANLQDESLENFSQEDEPQTFSEKIPDEILYPPGFVGELVRHNLRTAWFRQPELALAGALAAMATLTGGKICDESGTRTNLYLLSLAPSRSGKEHARKLNRELFLAAGCEDLLGPEEIGSHAAIYSWLAEHPTMLFQLDEIGRKFATMQDARKSPHLWNIISVWLKLWSSSDSMLKGDAYADLKKTKTLLYPHAVIYGTSVPHSVWENLTRENVSDGLLARFLVFEGVGYRDLAANTNKASDPLPSVLVDAAKSWRELRTHEGNLNSVPSNASPIKLATSPEARQRWQEHNEAVVERRRDEDDVTAAVWSGTPEKTAKLALLFAASRWDGSSGMLPIVEFDDMDRAVGLANHLTRLMLDRADRHVAESESDRNSKRVLEAIRKLGLNATQSEVCRATQGLSRRERDEAISNLVQCLKITSSTVKTKTKPKTIFRITQ